MTKEEFLGMVETEFANLKKEREKLQQRLTIQQDNKENTQSYQHERLFEIEKEIKSIKAKINLIDKKISVMRDMVTLPAQAAIDKATDTELQSYKTEMVEDVKRKISEAEQKIVDLEHEKEKLEEEQELIAEQYKTDRSQSQRERYNQLDEKITTITAQISSITTDKKKQEEKLKTIEAASLENIRIMLTNPIRVPYSRFYPPRDITIMDEIMSEVSADQSKKYSLVSLIEQYNEKRNAIRSCEESAEQYEWRRETISDLYRKKMNIPSGYGYYSQGPKVSEVIKDLEESVTELQTAITDEGQTVDKERLSLLCGDTIEINQEFTQKFKDCLEKRYVSIGDGIEIDGEHVSPPNHNNIKEAIAQLQQLTAAREALRAQKVFFLNSKGKKEKEHSMAVYSQQIKFLQEGIINSVRRAMESECYEESRRLSGERISLDFSDKHKLEGSLANIRFQLASKVHEMNNLKSKLLNHQQYMRSGIDNLKRRQEEILDQIIKLGGPRFENVDKSKIEVPMPTDSLYDLIDDKAVQTYSSGVIKNVNEEAQRQAKAREQELFAMMSEQPQEQIDAQTSMKK